MTLDEVYYNKCRIESDINEHLPVLREYGEKVNHITEMGVRDIVSTYAFLAARPKQMVSYDIMPIDTNHIHSLAPYTEYNFILGDTRQVMIEPTELLFIDTLHTYEQLKTELSLHAHKTSKFIIFHDTEIFGVRGQDGSEGLLKAIDEFLEINPVWTTHLHLKNNNGLTILKKSI
jgi:hypothetical protein